MSETSSPHDRILITRACEGDRDAFGLLVRRYQRRVWITALQITHNGADADDLTQEVFLKAYRALARFDFRADFFTWLYRITVNTTLNFLARPHRSRTVAGDDALLTHAAERLSVASEDPRSRLEVRQLCRQALEAIETLKPELRVALVLHVIQGMSHREVSEVMDCAEGTVAWRINEARKQLRRKLGSALGGERKGDDLSRGNKAPLGLP